VGPERQLLSKNPSFTPFLRSLNEAFPDGRFLCCVRDPVEVVPSLLSSISTGAGIFGYDVSDPRIRDRFVDMLQFFSEHALATLETLPDDRYAYVPLKEVKRDISGFVLGTYDRFGWEADQGFRDCLAQESMRNTSYRSRHTYSLEDYGLAEPEVRTRFASLIRHFGFSGHEAGPGGYAGASQQKEAEPGRLADVEGEEKGERKGRNS
jgi:hypothetical protein